MHHLVRVVQKEGKKVAQLYVGTFDSLEELDERTPDAEAPATEAIDVHNRLNDSEMEARHYFRIVTR